MIFTVLLIVILIAVIYLYYFRRIDRFEPESIFHLLIAFIVGGIVSIIISFVLYFLFPAEQSFIDAFTKIGPIEELGKLGGLAAVYLLIKKEFDEPLDGMVYIACVSLGFASIENLFYVLNSNDPFFLLFQRSIICIIGHVTFSSLMGFSFYIHKRINKNYKGLIAAWLMASFGHGLYDAVVFEFTNYSIPMIIILLVLLNKVQLDFVNYCLNISQFRRYYSRSLFTPSNRMLKVDCLCCLNNNESQVFEYEVIEVVFCSDCGALNVDLKEWKRMYYYFRPNYKSGKLRIINKDFNGKSEYLDVEREIHFSNKTGKVATKRKDLGKWFERVNSDDLKNNKRYFKSLVKLLGFKEENYYLNDY